MASKQLIHSKESRESRLEWWNGGTEDFSVHVCCSHIDLRMYGYYLATLILMYNNIIINTSVGPLPL